jgi:hypothetical protein
LVTGVGFLGGGAIIKLGAAALILALTVLRGRRRWLRHFAPTKETVLIRLTPTTDAGSLLEALKSHSRLEVRSLSVPVGGPTIAADLNGIDPTKLLAELAARGDIVNVEVLG